MSSSRPFFEGTPFKDAEQPVEFGLDRIKEISAELIEKFNRQGGLKSVTTIQDIQYLSGVLYEVWQRGRACGMREERERRADLGAL